MVSIKWSFRLPKVRNVNVVDEARDLLDAPPSPFPPDLHFFFFFGRFYSQILLLHIKTEI